MTDAVAAAVAAIDTDRLVELVAQVCRIPSVLGDEGPLAEFLHDLMKRVRLRGDGAAAGDRQPAERAGRAGVRRRAGGSCSPGTWTPSRCPTAGPPPRRSPARSSTASVYGHGIMDMKAALVCQIVAMEALRDSGVPLAGTLAMAAVSDHMGDQLGSIAYFDSYPADLAVLGELSDNEIFLGHRGRAYFDITVLGKSAHTCHKPLAVNANPWPRTPSSSSTPRTSPRCSTSGSTDLFGPETYMVARPDLRRPAAGRPLDDPGRVRDPGRLPPAARRDHRAGPGRDRPLPGRGGPPRPALPGRGRAGRRQDRLPGRPRRRGRDAHDGRGPPGPRAASRSCGRRAGWATPRASARRCRRSSSAPAASRCTARTSTSASTTSSRPPRCTRPSARSRWRPYGVSAATCRPGSRAARPRPSRRC